MRLKEAFEIFGPIVATIIVALVLGEAYGAHVCSSHQDITGQNTKRIMFDSCYVEHDGVYLRWEDYKNRMIAKEGLNK